MFTFRITLLIFLGVANGANASYQKVVGSNPALLYISLVVCL